MAALNKCDGSAGNSPAKWAGSFHDFGQFSLFVPDSAGVARNDSTPDDVSLHWPICSDKCRFSIAVRPDSGVSVEARIARIVSEQKAVDSANNDPQAVGGEFNVIDGPPKPFIARGARGYAVNDDCGDCASRTALVGMGGYIATIVVGGDDNMPDGGRRLCEMDVVAKTFAWKRTSVP